MASYINNNRNPQQSLFSKPQNLFPPSATIRYDEHTSIIQSAKPMFDEHLLTIQSVTHSALSTDFVVMVYNLQIANNN